MKKLSHYDYNKRWRQKYPKKWAIAKKKNYAQTGGPEKNKNHYARWTIHELNYLDNTDLTDRELHKIIGRSVQAIQNIRHKLKSH